MSRLKAHPAWLGALLALVLATSGFVQFEPAPSDALFFVFVGAVCLWPSSVNLRGFNMVAMAGAGIFLLGNFASLMASEAHVHATRYLAITIYMLLLFVLVAGWIGRHGEESAMTLQRAFCIGALIVAGIGILARFGIMPNPERYFLGEGALRIRSTFKDPNVFSPYIVAASMLVINDALTLRRDARNALVYGIAFALAILFAFSRGGMLHFAVSLLCYGAAVVFVIRQSEVTKRLVFLASIAGVALVAGLGYALAAAGLGEFFSERMTLQSYDTSERFVMQALALDVAAHNPLGIGPGEWSARGTFANDPHSTCLRVLAENGFLGLLGWLVWLGACCTTCLLGVFRRNRYSTLYACYGAILFGIFVEGFVIDTLHWRHLFFIASLPIGIRIVEYDETARARSHVPSEVHSARSPEEAEEELFVFVDADGDAERGRGDSERDKNDPRRRMPASLREALAEQEAGRQVFVLLGDDDNIAGDMWPGGAHG